MFHFDNYPMTINLLHRKYTFNCIKNWLVVIEIISWITIEESLNNFVLHLANNYSVNTCNYMEKGVLCTWVDGTMKEVVKSGTKWQNDFISNDFISKPSSKKWSIKL